MYLINGTFSKLQPELIGINRNNNFINIPIVDRFPNKNYKKGKIIGYNSEKNNNTLISLRKAAEVHKQARIYIQTLLKPGVNLLTIANKLESKVRFLLKNKGLNEGNGFPTGLSLDNCAAHWTPHYKQIDKKLTNDSVLKIDFGVHDNEWIVDSAFTIAFDSKYKPLLDAVKEATWTGIKNAKIDMPINDWGGLIREVMESYEVELDGTIYPVKVIKNLGGHNILKGHIHGDIFLPAFNYPIKNRFKEGVYAVETYGSVKGNGYVIPDNSDNSHYTLKSLNYFNSPIKKVNKVYSYIKNKFNTLPFCDRWIDDKLYHDLGSSCKNYLDVLAKNNIVQEYPPLYDKKGSKTAQYEHTIYISDGRTEVLSTDTDY